ncbi:prenyltransferase/squalene oxidase repeat-containing protein [Rubritalea marina]|uniref:prenyltransferase/squalene oxidase repeat-containing protein n=1 Tax=Rubritalea marina TaxID=361055 RepID=UPI000364BA38|nr:prenyltransferase/squalene oxidase repeat-containing protein [Rubritalea marina]
MISKSLRNTLAVSLAAVTSLSAATNPEAPYLSLKLEMEHAIAKGNKFLRETQEPEGFWRNKKIPAYTALALTAARRSPNAVDNDAPEVKKGYEWLVAQQHKDGGIYVKGLATYNTATSLTSLVASGQPEHKESILAARRFLINQQQDWDIRGETDNVNDGGIGYGGSYPHSDLSNTHFAVEAIKLSEAYAKDTEKRQPELNWDAAIQFISRTQNLEETNDQPGISNDGSFVYFPGNSKAGTQTEKDGRETLRGYGSMSYAGLLSFIYADLDENDVRVKAVKQWLNDNYTLDENPGLGQQGLFYYYQVMAKALNAAGIDTLTISDGQSVDWRKELAGHLLGLQKPDGSWINENSRWWENEAELTTAYVILALEQIYVSIPHATKK